MANKSIFWTFGLVTSQRMILLASFDACLVADSPPDNDLIKVPCQSQDHNVIFRSTPKSTLNSYPYHSLLKKFPVDNKGRSEEHTSELQSPVPISYAVFCLKKKKKNKKRHNSYAIKRHKNYIVADKTTTTK